MNTYINSSSQPWVAHGRTGPPFSNGDSGGQGRTAPRLPNGDNGDKEGRLHGYLTVITVTRKDGSTVT
jgi:hypothetical protein